jgi:hypothetical protein
MVLWTLNELQYRLVHDRSCMCFDPSNEFLMGAWWIKLFALLIALLFLSRCACLLDRFWLWKNDILFLNPTRWLLHLKSVICSRGLLGPVDFSSNLANAIMSEPDHWNCLHVHSSAWMHGYSSVSVPMVAAVRYNCIALCKHKHSNWSFFYSSVLPPFPNISLLES